MRALPVVLDVVVHVQVDVIVDATVVATVILSKLATVSHLDDVILSCMKHLNDISSKMVTNYTENGHPITGGHFLSLPNRWLRTQLRIATAIRNGGCIP